MTLTRSDILHAFGVTEEDLAPLDAPIGPAEEAARQERRELEARLPERIAEVEREINERFDVGLGLTAQFPNFARWNVQTVIQ